MQIVLPLRRTRSVFATAITFALLLAAPRAAHAHGNLKSSQPAAGAQLMVAPRELRLDFTEVPELAFTNARLLGPGGETVALSPLGYATDSHRSVVVPIRGALSAGTYSVLWQMAGADGHVMRGRFSFTIAPNAAGLGATGGGAYPAGEPGGAVIAPGQSAPPAAHHAAAIPEGEGFGAEAPLYVVIRWLQFVGLLVLIGAVAFRLFVLGFLRRERGAALPILAPAGARAARFALLATALVGVAALLRLYAQSYAMHGGAQAMNGALIATMLGHTTWGWGWIVQAVGVVVAALGFLAARRARASGWGIAAVGALMLAVTPALSGHAVSAPRLTPLAVLADGAHIIGASGWLGSLLLVVAVGIPTSLALDESERGRAVADLVNAFSPTALVFAGLTAATGVFAAWLHLGAVPALWQTRYGQLLLLKLAILSVVAGTGAYNWLRVKPALGDERGAARMRRSASVELAVGVVVLAVTAVLVATPTAMDIAAMRP